MEIPHPLIITSRLLPGITIGDGTISVDAGPSGLVAVFDLPSGEYRDGNLRGPECHGGRFGSLLEYFDSLLSFLSACAESRAYSSRNHSGDPMKGENSDLFPAAIGEWAEHNSEEIQLANCELEEALASVVS